MQLERQTLADDRVKLELFRNELKSKQTAIEEMRFTFIKETSEEGRYHFSQQAKDLALAKLQGFKTTSELSQKPTTYSPPAPPAHRQ